VLHPTVRHRQLVQDLEEYHQLNQECMGLDMEKILCRMRSKDLNLMTKLLGMASSGKFDGS